jgi:hypothetical protein
MVDQVRSPDEELEASEGPFTNPRPALWVGLGTTVTALVLSWIVGAGLGPVRFGLLAVGVLAGSIAVVIRPRSAAVLALAAVITLLASITGPSSEWDSARMVLRILTAVAGVAAVVVLLPRPWGRIAVSLLILFHFGGITVAVTSPDQNWVSNQLWYYFYRPYLQFMYLNNAYHFYAPEPGPTPLLWFCIEYEQDQDGRNLRWVKVPALDQNGIPRRPDGSRLWPNLEYTRRLSLAEGANFPRNSPHPLVFQLLLEARQRAGQQRHVPMRNDLYADMQYREPSDTSKLYIQSYVRHVASRYPHETKPNLKVQSVKLYKVIHQLINAPYLAEGAEPTDPTLYLPYFMGEFDPEGNLKTPAAAVEFSNPETGQPERRDPFLYWLIPIMRTVDDPQTPFRTLLRQKVVNYVKIHAGDPDEGDLP